MTLNELQAAFSPFADATRAQSQSAYMRNQFPFLGLETATRRKAAAPFLSHRPLDWPFVWELWKQPEREFHYVACDHLRRIKNFPASQLDTLRELIATNSWWDTVDSLAKVAGFTLPEGTETMRAWAIDENMWVRRAAIICQLGLRLETDTDLLTFAIEHNLPQRDPAGAYATGGEDAAGGEKDFSREFFITKAIGWALRDYYRHNPSWVLDFCQSRQLEPLSRREALKHH